MIYYPQYDENGKKILCEMNGINSEMLMDIYVKKLKSGESLEICESENETAVLLLSGKVEFSADSVYGCGKRKNPFEKSPYAIHFSKNTKCIIKAFEESEILVQQTDNEKEFATILYTPDDCTYQEFGKGQWGGAGHRICSTIFDYSSAPYSNMVMGEVFNQPGKWSSYPPHHHPQPELYYYQFDRPEGFGAGFEGDNAYKTTNGSCLCINGGNAHQQVTAPGFEMYYVWLIRHLDGDPWDKTRIYLPEYEWLADAK